MSGTQSRVGGIVQRLGRHDGGAPVAEYVHHQGRARFGQIWSDVGEGNTFAKRVAPTARGHQSDPLGAVEYAGAGRGIRVTCAVHAEQRALLAGLEGISLLKLHTIESRTNWMSSQAMGTAIVPPDLPRTLLSTLD